MSGTVEQNAWVQRVLGVSTGGPGSKPVVRLPNFNGRKLWREAKETVDGQLNTVAGKLRAYQDPDLDRIAEYGLFGIGSNQNVTLAKALIEYETAVPAKLPGAALKLRNAVTGYRQLLNGETVVRLIDEVPLTPAPTLRATLGGALDAIERAMG